MQNSVSTSVSTVGKFVVGPHSSDTVYERNGNNKTTGQPYTLRLQRAMLHKPNGERVAVEIRRPDTGALEPGDYLLHGDSFGVNRYGRLEIETVTLIRAPVLSKPSTQRASAA